MNVPPDDATLRAEAELRASMDVAMLRARVRELGTENTTLRDRITTLEAALIEATARGNWGESNFVSEGGYSWREVDELQAIYRDEARAELVAAGLVAE